MKRINLVFCGLMALAMMLVTACQPKEESKTNVKGVSLGVNEFVLMIGRDTLLTAVVIPDDATDKSVVWSSDKESVATVDNGLVKGIAEGTACIIARTVDGGFQAECEVTVVKPYLAVKHMQADRLPDMNTARADHVLFVANGQLTVAGGHVNGFLLTKSAEYLEDGEWHSMTMNYNHDMAFSVLMSNGKMMIGGGCSSGSGVGQSSNVELYDPSTHSFSVMASMNNNRTYSHAVELADGNVAVSGNWWTDDAIELYSSTSGEFIDKGTVSEDRTTPYVLRSGLNQAIIFSPIDPYGNFTNSLIVDRLEGESFTVDLFDTWRPMRSFQNWRAADCEIADYTYLITAKNDNDSIGIMKVEGETFSMLKTELPIPLEESGTKLEYSGQIFTNKTNKVAYMPAFSGNSESIIYYILKVDYGTTPAKLTLYKTDEMDAYASIYCMTMLPDGRLVACGGVYNSNFHPYPTVLAFSPF